MQPALQQRQDENAAARRATTIATIRSLHALGHGEAPSDEIPNHTHPIRIEEDYGSVLSKLAEHARREIHPLVVELPSLVASSRAALAHDSLRADAGEARRARELVRRARVAMANSLTTAHLEKVAHHYADQTNAHSREVLQAQTKAVFGVPVIPETGPVTRAHIDAFVGENVALIKTIPGDPFDEVEQLVTRGFTSGQRHETIAAALQERFNIAERRARLIARDQVGKLNGQLAATRQKALGAEWFIWRSVGDIRVRGTPGGPFAKAVPSHYLRDGKRYRYDAPPEGEMPGMPVCCRCGPEADWSAILAGLDD